VSLQRAALVDVERSGRQPLDGDAVESVAEDEMLGHPIARREQGLLDLSHGHSELGGGLVDEQAVQLPEDVDAPLSLGQRGERGHERARLLRAVGRRPVGELRPRAARAAV